MSDQLADEKVIEADSNSSEEPLMFKPKDKTYNYCYRTQMKLKNSTHYFILTTCLVIIGYFSLSYLRDQPVVFLSTDRSEAYNVKIIPASLNDVELNLLPKETFSYLAMIDAGSSGCRAHVYRFGKLGTISGPLYILPQHDSKKVKPGLSSFAQTPEDAGASLKGLIDFMKEQVPENDWSVTPIWLKATAGLRMLDKTKSDLVLQSVRSFLSDKQNSPFLFRSSWARIIPGNEEGGFGWIAFNYLKKIIGPKKTADSDSPYAVVEMGGASAQVSQVAPTLAEAEKIPQQHRFSFTIESDTYHLYTHSYLGFGAEQGREQLNALLMQQQKQTSVEISDPCLNTGYSRPASTPAAEPYQGPKTSPVVGSASKESGGFCVNTIDDIFLLYGSSSNNNSNSSSNNLRSTSNTSIMTSSDGNASGDIVDTAAASCSNTQPVGPYSFGCTYQPAFVAASPNFLVFENFYYVSSAIGVKPVVPPTTEPAATATAAVVFPLKTTADKIREASEAICTADWTAVQETYPLDSQPKDVNLKMCFVGSYAYSFLVHGLKLPKDKVLTVQREVGTSEIEWALGAAYKEAAELLKRTNLRPITH